MRLLITLALFFFSLSSAHAITGVAGTAVDKTTPPPPSGVCAGGAFNMSNAGFFLTTLDSTLVQLGIGPLENGFDGFGYVDVGQLGPNNIVQYKFDMQSLAQAAAPVNISIANTPDFVIGGLGSHYRSPFWVVLNQQITAPCNVTACLHVRTYTGGTLATDVATSVPSSAGSFTAATFDDTFTYVAAIDVTGQTIYKLQSAAYTITSQAFIDALNAVNGLANDNTFVYASYTTGNLILRWLKSNIPAGFTSFNPTLSGGALQPLTYDSGLSVLYAPVRSGGVSNNILYRVRTSDLTITGTLNFGITQFMGKALVDAVNNKIYVAMSSNGTRVQVARVNRSTFTIEATYSGFDTVNGQNLNFSSIDVPHQKLYMVNYGDGAGAVARIEKINLCG